jgi:hypothetical protein
MYDANGLLVPATLDAADASIPDWEGSLYVRKGILTQDGDLLIRKNGILTRLPIGGTGQVLTVAAGVPSWATGGGGGMSNPMTTTGDMIYSNPASTPVRLPIGTTGQVLTVAGGVPSWATSSVGITLPKIIQMKSNRPSAATVVLDSVPTTGNRLLLLIDSTGGVSAVSQPNVTWTQIATSASGSAHYDIWVGVVAAAAGTTITMTFTGFNSCIVVEITDALTPTLVASASGTNAAKLTAPATGRFIVGGSGADSTTNQGSIGFLSVPHIAVGASDGAGLCLVMGYSQGKDVYGGTIITTAAGFFNLAAIS